MARPPHFRRAGHQLRDHARDHDRLHVHQQLTNKDLKEVLHSMFFGFKTYHSEQVKQHFYHQHALILALVGLIILAMVIGFFQIR